MPRYPYKSTRGTPRPKSSGGTKPKLASKTPEVTPPQTTTWPIYRRLFTIAPSSQMLDVKLVGRWVLINACIGSVSQVDGTFGSQFYMRIENGDAIRISQGMLFRVPDGFESVSFENADPGQDWTVELLYGNQTVPAIERPQAWQMGCGAGFAGPSL